MFADVGPEGNSAEDSLAPRYAEVAIQRGGHVHPTLDKQWADIGGIDPWDSWVPHCQIQCEQPYQLMFDCSLSQGLIPILFVFVYEYLSIVLECVFRGIYWVLYVCL